MPALSAGDVIRASVRYSLPSGQDHVNVWHFVMDGAAALTDAAFQAAMSAFFDAVYARLNGRLSNGITPIDIKTDLVDFIGGVLKITDTLGLFPWAVSAFAPAQSGDVLPPQDAVLVKFLTGIGKVLGKKYIGGVAETGNNNGFPDASLIGETELFITDALAGVDFGSGVTGVTGVMSTKTQQFEPFIAGDIGTTFATQRRRRLGTGS